MEVVRAEVGLPGTSWLQEVKTDGPQCHQSTLTCQSNH